MCLIKKIKNIQYKGYRFVSLLQLIIMRAILILTLIFILTSCTGTVRKMINNADYDYNVAIKKFDEAIQRNSNNANLYQSRSLANLLLENYDSALSDINKSIELNSNSHAAAKKSINFNCRGLIYHHQGKDNLAILDFDKSIELNNKNNTAFVNKGNSLFCLKDTGAAINQLENSSLL